MARNTEFSLRVLLSVDAVGYGAGDDQRHRAIQTGLLAVLDRAAAQAGLDRSEWAKQQAGDGELAILPADQSDREPVIVDDFVRELSAALARHNEDLKDEARLRLRLAIHFGAAAPGANGYVGKGVVVVSRLVECTQIKNALRVMRTANLAVIISAQVFNDVVVPRYTALPRTAFREVPVRHKEFAESAYLLLPGYDMSAVEFPPMEGDEDPGATETQAGSGSPEPGPSSGGRQATVSTTVNGNVAMPHGVIGMVWNER
ncbi:hypothetical protein [Nocardia sp. NPDC050175]|uniref:hypothetical protein n=1 Tax=Nocardia sp. NPDC050175 TaxID=3364317 RepID=UPI0037A50E9A